MVTKREDVVKAARFKEALARAKNTDRTGPEIHLGGQCFRLYGRLGRGQHSDVYLGEHAGLLSGRVVLKVARTAGDRGDLEAEAVTLRRMKASPGLGAGYATQRLPELEGLGTSEGPEARERAVLVLRHQPGYWGTLADAVHRFPEGIDPRHMVWMWRRSLGLLALLHGAGWVHSDLAPEHLLVHPQDHGLVFIGWSRAHEVGSGGSEAQASFSRDLAQVAWSMRALLCGQGAIERIPANIPSPVAGLLERCCLEPDWACHQGAHGLDLLLKATCLQAFGSPVFLDFNPGARLAGPQA